jgi:hypothetical protein
MLYNNSELRLAFLAILFITAAYLFMVLALGAIPAANELFGHSLGILGFLLMVMTETLYSLRKRSRNARWGKMSAWLQFHIFTGIVGPYMVLLHTSWKFNGLAGILMLMTIVVVISGFIGRYIFTAVPRTVDGAEIEAQELERQITAIESELQRQASARPETARIFAGRLAASQVEGGGIAWGIWERLWVDWRERLRWQAQIRSLRAAERAQASHLDYLLRRRDTLLRQVRSLAAARRMLAVWHAVHIPIGLSLFSLAIVHIVAAVYFATLLH